MCMSKLQRSSSRLLRPDFSRPNTAATCRFGASPTILSTHIRGSITGHGRLLNLAEAPTTSAQSTTAASRSEQVRACWSMSSAPDARAMACWSSGQRGSTRTRRARPMVFMARAAAPILPECVVPTSTIRTLFNLRRAPRWPGLLDMQPMVGCGPMRRWRQCQPGLLESAALSARPQTCS